METRQIHVRDLSTVTGIQQYEHCVQSIFFLGLEDFEGTIYLSLESDKFSEDVALTNNTFIIGQPMTKFNVTYTCQIYGIVGTGEKIQLSKQFRMAVYKSNNISGEAGEYPIDPNFENSIVEFVNEQKAEIDTYTDAQKSEIEATGQSVIESIPSDYSTLEQATYNAYPTESESGNPIYFDDGAEDIPVKELIVNLEPKQEGEGDPSPSNIRPITGYDGVTVKRTGKNLLPLTLYSGVYNPSVGSTMNLVESEATLTPSDDMRTFTITLGTTWRQYALALEVDSALDYYANIAITADKEIGSSIVQLDSNYKVLTKTNESGVTSRTVKGKPTLLADAKYYVIVFTNRTYTNDTITFTEPQIELGSTATEYEPYVGQEYSITFPVETGTVYGGRLNVITGVLTVDRGFIASYNGETLPSTWISDRDVYASGTTPTTGAQVVYELATPTTVQLTPTEVTTLLGNNTISSDGSMELTYRADISKVIEKLTNAIISMGGNV